MSKEELEAKIIKIQNNMTQFEEGAEKKENYIRNRIDEESNPEINEFESKLQVEQNRLNEINDRINELTSIKKTQMTVVKDLNGKINSLKKVKNKALNEKLKAISKERTTYKKAHEKEIKELKKSLKAGEP